MLSRSQISGTDATRRVEIVSCQFYTCAFGSYSSAEATIDRSSCKSVTAASGVRSS